jgi:hypothetical protein
MKRLIGTHRKTGSVWMRNIFEDVCDKFGLRFKYNDPIDFDILVQDDSKFNLDDDYRGIHLTRDFRDIIISGCFYNSTANEKWLSKPNQKFGGMSYQEKINSIDNLEDKLIFEMNHVGKVTISEIQTWEKNPKFLEVKYEELIIDNNLELFTKIFKFLEFPSEWMEDLLNIAWKNSIFSVSNPTDLNDVVINGRRKNIYHHIRHAKPEQWKGLFTKRVNEEFNKVMETIKKRFNLVSVCCTTICNAKCYFCTREHFDMKKIGSINLDLNVLNHFSSRIDFLSLNGSFGDAIHNPTLMEFLKKNPYLKVEIATNGGAKNIWTELGKMTNVTVIFGIDGLEDTHYRYRHTNFKKVIDNMVTYIESGGKAIWQYIIFDYNEHQVKKASELAKKLGCKEFKVIRSNAYNSEFGKPKNINSRDDIIKKRSKLEYCYWKSRDNRPFRSIAIDVCGYVHPCCHISFYAPFFINHSTYTELKELFNENKDKINLYNNNIDDIINNPYFKYIYDNFNNLHICNEMCGGIMVKGNEDQPKTLDRIFYET